MADGLRLCPTCLNKPPPFERVVAPWVYDEQMAALIHSWKFLGEHHLTPLLARLWLDQMETTPTVDVIVPVPLHWWRLCRRGFNQAELLCHQLQRQNPGLNRAKLHTRLVSRSRATGSQSRLTIKGRRENLAGAFKVNRSCAGLRVAVVDDIMTTGSTLSALAGSLLDAGASSVEAWCIARTPAPPN